MSAPAAKAFSEPVMTMAPTLASASKTSSAWHEFLDQAGVEGIQGLRPVEPYDGDTVTDLGGDAFIDHGRPLEADHSLTETVIRSVFFVFTQFRTEKRCPLFLELL